MKTTRHDVMLRMVATALMHMAMNGTNAEYATMNVLATYELGGDDTFGITRAEILERIGRATGGVKL